MDAKKTVILSMDEIKELTFHLERALLKLQEQFDNSMEGHNKLLLEKIDFLKEIVLKLSS